MSDYDFVEKPEEHWVQLLPQQHQQQQKIEQKDNKISDLQKQLTEQKDQNQKIKESFEHFVKTAQSYTPKDKFKDFIHQLLPYDWSKSKQEIPSDIGIINKSAQVDNITQPRQEDIIAFIEEHLKQFEDKIKIQTKDQVKQIMEIKQREIVDSILQQLTKDQVTKFCEAQEMHLKQLNQKVQEITSKLISVKEVGVHFSNSENSQKQELQLQQIEQQISQQVQSLQTKYQTNLNDMKQKLENSQKQELQLQQIEQQISQQVQSLQTKYGQIATNLNDMKLKLENQLLTQVQLQLQTNMVDLQNQFEQKIKLMIEEKLQLFQRTYTDNTTNLKERQGNQDHQLYQMIMELQQRQRVLDCTEMQSLQFENANFKEKQWQSNKQIQENLKAQIQFIIQLNSKLKKYQEDESNQQSLLQPEPPLPHSPQFAMKDMLEQCNVSIPNPVGPIQIINKLYTNSWKKRHTDPQFLPFVREEKSQNDLFKNYSIRASQIKQKLKEYCTSFRQPRGDGNCFYTAFGYQFLLTLLLKYDDSQFIAFIKEMKKIRLSMKINLDKIKFDNEQEESQLLNNFFHRLIKLRSIPDQEDRKEQYTKQFAAYEYENDVMDGQFYGLSTIFFRNLANYAVEFSDMKEDLFDRQNLLIWELECNSNEIVIAALAKYLKIHVQLLFFDNNDFNDQQQYEVNSNYHKIILLMKPGHYNIGIKETDTKLDEQQQPIEQRKLMEQTQPMQYIQQKEQKQQALEIYPENNGNEKNLQIQKLTNLMIQSLEEYAIRLRQQLEQMTSLSNSQVQSEDNIY